MKYFRGIAIDNGGSEVRVLPSEEDVTNILTYDNKFKKIEESDFRVKETENPFELVRITRAPKAEYCGIYAYGATAELYSGKMITLNTQSKKTDCLEYYMQIVCDMAVDAGINDVYAKSAEELESVKAGKKTIFDMGRSWEYVMTVVIPIAEHSGKVDRAAIFKDNIVGTYEVEFPLVKDTNMVRTFSVRPENIGVLPEGGVVVSRLKKEIGPEDFTIGIDMGHVSTDLSLFKGTKLFGSTVITSTRAGSVLLANCKAALADAGYILTDEATLKAIETGKVKSGNKDVDVSGIIKDEKQLFANNCLAQDILSLLNRNGINASQIQNIVPVGAAFNERDNVDTGSILNDALKALKMSDVNILRAVSDLRYANVIQAQQFCKVLLQRAVKLANAETMHTA